MRSEHVDDLDGGMAWTVSERAVAAVALGLIVVALCSRWLGADHASTAALKTIAATLTVGAVPGVLLTLLWRPKRASVLELAGFGIVLSFGVVQLLTVVAVAAHVSAAVMLTMLLAASVLAGGRVVQRATGRITVGADELIVLAFVLALSWSVYAVGSPVDWNEDQIHASIARRLSQLDSPRLDNLYVTPGIVYTYPFPGTHYFIGLIARLGDIDALFVYHKLRFFWGLTVLLMVHLAARAVFGRRGVASAVVVTVAVLAWAGIFASTGFGQLVPSSHASDIAVGVLLPCLLVAAFSYLQSVSSRERTYFATATAMLVLMLTMVHMREVVQFAAYLGCFAVMAAMCRGFRPYLARTIALLVLTIGCAAIFAAWQGTVTTIVGDIVDARRAELTSMIQRTSPWELLVEPASVVLPDVVQRSEETSNGLLPFFLFGGPVVVVMFRHRPLVWLIASGIVAYLLVMSVPLLAIPYVYVTYFEILHLPVRNVIFFVYVLSGVVLYAAAVAMTRIGRGGLSSMVAGVLCGALALLTTLCLNRSHWGFFAPLVVAYATAFLSIKEGFFDRQRATRVALVSVVTLAGLVLMWPERAPTPRSERVSVRWSSELPDERRADLEVVLSLGEGQRQPDRTSDENVWDYRVTDLSVDHIRSIVTHPDVVDTHFIERSTFEVESHPPLRDPPLGMRYVRWTQYPGATLFAGTAIVIWGLGLVLPVALATARGRVAITRLQAALGAPFYRHALAFALFIVPFIFWTARPSASPLAAALAEPAGHWATPRAMIDGLPCVTLDRMEARFTERLFPDDPLILPERTVCPPDLSVIEWMQEELPVDAVLAIDRWDTYPSVMFSPQQVDIFPTLDASFVDEDRLFGQYYGFFYERMRKYRVQPFFNNLETPAERDAFVKALGVTHILVNPAHYDELGQVLDGLPTQFVRMYTNGRWAIYEVSAPGAAGG
jgi:hypothetical protein